MLDAKLLTSHLMEPAMSEIDLTAHGILVSSTLRNATPARLYEEALGQGACITNQGALAFASGPKTQRCSADKRIVDESLVTDDIWWGDVNIRLDPVAYHTSRHHAVGYLNTRPQLYVTDGYAGWDPRHRLKIRVVSESACHALVMSSLLVRPADVELAKFGDPDFTVINAGRFSANPFVTGVNSESSIALSFENRELVILGTEYAGEIKKGIFTAINYLMPQAGILSLHCSANEDSQGKVALFFGATGAGKTTLSMTPDRSLIGDDEHCWGNEGVYNLEGGCYAKASDLTREDSDAEPEILAAIRFGTVLENVVVEEGSRNVDFGDTSITQNMRATFPLEHLVNAKIPAVGGHPQDIILLTCDAFGVLPPVCRLNADQLMYHFMSGYSADLPASEATQAPVASFNACYSEAFLVWHPLKYAQLLAEKAQQHRTQAWLVNTGWRGGSIGQGQRIAVEHTRAIIRGIHNGSLAKQKTAADTVFGLECPIACDGVPDTVLAPRQGWKSDAEYRAAAEKLALLYNENFAAYSAGVPKTVRNAGPLSKAKRPRPRTTVG